MGKIEGRTRKILVTLNSPWEARLLVHKAVQAKLYVTNNVLFMPALPKEDLGIEQKVLLRKRCDQNSKGIAKDCLKIKNLKQYKDGNEVKLID